MQTHCYWKYPRLMLLYLEWNKGSKENVELLAAKKVLRLQMKFRKSSTTPPLNFNHTWHRSLTPWRPSLSWWSTSRANRCSSTLTSTRWRGTGLCLSNSTSLFLLRLQTSPARPWCTWTLWRSCRRCSCRQRAWLGWTWSTTQHPTWVRRNAMIWRFS